MVSGNIFFKKNDFCRDLIQDPRQRVFSYHWSLQDMASLFERLQAQSVCPYKLQQLLLFYGYKELELQIGPLGPKTLQIQFSNRLPLKQSKCSCRYFVEVSAEKPG